MKVDFKTELYAYGVKAKELTVPAVMEGFGVSQQDAERVLFELVKEGVFDYTPGIVYVFNEDANVQMREGWAFLDYSVTVKKVTAGVLAEELEMDEAETEERISYFISRNVLVPESDFLFRYTGKAMEGKAEKDKKKKYSFFDDDDDEQGTSVEKKETFIERMRKTAFGSKYDNKKADDDEDEEDDDPFRDDEDDEDEDDDIYNEVSRRTLERLAAKRKGQRYDQPFRRKRRPWVDGRDDSVSGKVDKLFGDKTPNIFDNDDDDDDDDKEGGIIEMGVGEYIDYCKFDEYIKGITKAFNFTFEMTHALWRTGISYPDDTQMEFRMFLDGDEVWLGDSGNTMRYLGSRYEMSDERIQKRLRYILDDYTIKTQEDGELCIRLRDGSTALMSFLWFFAAIERCISIHSEGLLGEIAKDVEMRCMEEIKKIVFEQEETYEDAKQYAQNLLTEATERGDESEKLVYAKVLSTFEAITEDGYESFKREIRGDDE